MKIPNFFVSFRAPALVAAFLFSVWNLNTSAIPLTGKNGTTAEIAGIKSAGPKGLTVQIKEGDPAFELSWEKIDLEKMRSQYPDLDAAYKRALGGQLTELNLGTFAPKAPEKKMAPQVRSGRTAEKEGYFEVNVREGEGEEFGSATFAISMPSSGSPKGILLLSRGQNGLSIGYMARVREHGPWAPFQTELNFAILSYNFDVRRDDDELYKTAPYIFAEKGSGRALLDALTGLEGKTGASLSKLPIAVYGADIMGAAFAYNFTQWKPERVIAAVVSKGAFYAAPPTAESVKVPLLMIWGEYNSEPKIWKASHTHAEIFGDHVNLKPNWVYAMEPRGQNDESPFSHHLGKTFLTEMIKKRLSGAELSELDRTGSWVGDLDKFEISKLADPEAVLATTQTWLPDEEFAEMWKLFVNGRLPIPGADAAP